MKSIIEEASSIAKAIENGWLKAGKPQEFSIKIFEEPERNFFGMTKRSAKVGIFYNDNQSKSEQGRSKGQATSPILKKTSPTPRIPQIKQPEINAKPIEDKIVDKNSGKNFTEKAVTERSHHDQVIWTPEMIANVNAWLKQVLDIIQSPAQFSITAERFHLKVQFDRNLFDDKNREKQFFSGLSILLFQTLKFTYRRPLKGFKILFSSEACETSIT